SPSKTENPNRGVIELLLVSIKVATQSDRRTTSDHKMCD
ncbi:MAG: hypothetical protein QOH20_5226, partial [Mycobacterium sp.]|nr:hypothetical protein [Mycobacterium sp.]